MTFYCPLCRKKIQEDDGTCPHCGADITSFEQKSFDEKLIQDLHHSDRETVRMAVRTLGRRRTLEAVDSLLLLFEMTDDPFLQREILDALDKIGTEDALNFIMESLDNHIDMVRRRAWEIMENRETKKSNP